MHVPACGAPKVTCDTAWSSMLAMLRHSGTESAISSLLSGGARVLDQHAFMHHPRSNVEWRAFDQGIPNSRSSTQSSIERAPCYQSPPRPLPKPRGTRSSSDARVSRLRATHDKIRHVSCTRGQGGVDHVHMKAERKRKGMHKCTSRLPVCALRSWGRDAGGQGDMGT